MISFQQVFMRTASLSDYSDILAITEGEDLWDGCDYLPGVLRDWLEDEDDKGEDCKIRSFVFVVSKQIVGFRSLIFQSKNCAVKSAFRVKKELRGKGYGREIRNIFEEHLRKYFQPSLVTLLCVPDWDLSDEELKSPHYGDLLLVRPYMVFTFKASNLVINSTDGISLTIISKEEFISVLRIESVTKRLIERNVLHIDFTPIVLDNDEAIECAADKDQIVMVEGSVKKPKSFSIFTNPYSVPKGKKCSGLDIFCDTETSYKAHFLAQMNLLKSKVENQEDDVETFLNISCKEDQVLCASEACNSLFGSNTKLGYGSKKRKITRMYIYKKTYQKR